MMRKGGIAQSTDYLRRRWEQVVSVVDGAERKRGSQINVSLFGLIGLLRAWRDRTLGQKADRYLGGGDGGWNGPTALAGERNEIPRSREYLPRVEDSYRDGQGT